MSFSDLGKKTAPHVDTPAQAEARAQAMADLKARADARSAKAAVQREGRKAPEAGAVKAAEKAK